MINLLSIISSLLRSLYYIKRVDNDVNNQEKPWNKQNYENEEDVLNHEDENHQWEDLIKDENEEQ